MWIQKGKSPLYIVIDYFNKIIGEPSLNISIQENNNS